MWQEGLGLSRQDSRFINGRTKRPNNFLQHSKLMFNGRTSPTGLSVSQTSKTISKFYRRHYELISKFNVGFKTLLREGLSEPESYGNLDFSFQFRKIILRFRRIGYNLNVM